MRPPGLMSREPLLRDLDGVARLLAGCAPHQVGESGAQDAMYTELKSSTVISITGRLVLGFFTLSPFRGPWRLGWRGSDHHLGL